MIESGIPIPDDKPPSAEDFLPELPQMGVGDSVLVKNFPLGGYILLTIWDFKNDQRHKWKNEGTRDVRVWRIE